MERSIWALGLNEPSGETFARLFVAITTMVSAQDLAARASLTALVQYTNMDRRVRVYEEANPCHFWNK